MDKVQEEIVSQWFHKAENDLRNIRNNISADEVPVDTICFHAQQAIEKVLKAVLIANGRNVSKTHDLVRLLTEVLEFVPELATFEERLEEISEYGVAVRYPNGFSEPTLDEACRAYQVAQDVKDIVTLKLKFRISNQQGE